MRRVMKQMSESVMARHTAVTYKLTEILRYQLWVDKLS